MDCFKIEWKGFYSADTVHDNPESKGKGVYAVYDVEYDEHLIYIGKSQELGQRFKQHMRKTLSGRTDRKLKVCLGIIHPIAGSRISPQQLNAVEKILISSVKPKENRQSKHYVGKPIMVINTGKIGSLKKVISSHPDLLQLLKDNLSSW
jgi:excinuclease UvrABC nuclease subunit